MLEKLTLEQLLNYSSKKYADNIALSWIDGEPVTFNQLQKKVNSLSQFLIDEGVQPGDKIAILSENSVNWGISYFAITTMGAIAVPIMTEFKSVEIQHILRHSESKILFVSAKQYEKVEECTSSFLTTKILLDDFSIIPDETKADKLKAIMSNGLKEFQKIRFAALKIVGLAHDEIKEEDIALILYTSGTTGHSKGVMLSHKNIVYNAIATQKLVNLSERDRLLSILPLYHTYEATLGFVTPILSGSSVYYMKKSPTAAALLPALKVVKPTVILSVPLVIEKIYRNKILGEINKKKITKTLYKLAPLRKKMNKIAGKKLSETFGKNLRLFCIGGSSLAEDVEKFLLEAKFPYSIGYGLTETSPLVTGTDNFNVRFRSAGYALDGIDIKIDDPDKDTGEGEVLIKGPSVMKGYYKDPEKSAEVLSEDGWFRSGDLGVIDKNGYLFLKGRLKNVIIGSNGKNIYPEEVESIINEQEFVAESLVTDKDGVLFARVYLNYEQIEEALEIQKMNDPEARKVVNKILDDVHKNANERLNTFSKLSKIIEQIEPFEKTPTQKIKRYLYL